MGVNTDASICFGILYEEDFRFPWNKNNFEDDIEDWWKHINGYKNPYKSPFCERGNYLPEYSRLSPEVDLYFSYSIEWKEKNPLPIELVNYCYIDNPMYIIAVKETVSEAHRGSPKSFDPNTLVVSDEQKRVLIDFCEKHIGKVTEQPKWWLSSYWG